jgi:MoaA/NifB/PqqE/SkfB family radical SAM enzyme
MIDLSHELTVFIISAGDNPNYSACKNSIANQTVKFKTKYIIDVSPMSLAFQQMIDQCDTAFYIQVDNDMVLKPDAIENMFNLMNKQILINPKTVIYNCLLNDPHLERNICGIKIYRHDIIAKYPYKISSNSCEKTQIEDMQKDGWHLHFGDYVAGQHSPKWTNALVFERYFTLMGKAKEFGYTWLEKLPKFLKDKFIKEPSDVNFHAMQGAMLNIMQADNGLKGEKDFRSMKKPAVGLLEGWLYTQPTQASLHVTANCNLNCEFCHRQLDPQNPINHRDMDLAMVDTILNKFPTIQGVHIAGFGEPFLNPHLGYIIQKLKTKGKYVGMTTNGTLLAHKLSEFSKIYNGFPDDINISFNSANPIDYAKVTGHSLFNKVVDGVIACREYKIKHTVSFVCYKSNISAIMDFLHFVYTELKTGVHLHNLLPHSGFDNDSEWFVNNVFTDKDNAILDEIKEYDLELQKEYGGNWILNMPKPISFDYTSRNCKFAWNSISVDGDGNLSPCLCVDPCHAKNGNIKDGIVWNNQAYLNLRESLLSEQRAQCKVCFRNFQ